MILSRKGRFLEQWVTGSRPTASKRNIRQIDPGAALQLVFDPGRKYKRVPAGKYDANLRFVQGADGRLGLDAASVETRFILEVVEREDKKGAEK